jgi:predicted transcriptional regulator
MTDLLQLDPIALIILFIAGGGVIYVVNIFTKAQTIREREMWAALQSMMNNVKDINENWLDTYKGQGEKSNDNIRDLSNNIAQLTTQTAELTAAVDKSIETGASIQGASKLMVDILRNGGDSRKGA